MSQVSHDSSWIYQYEETYEKHHNIAKKEAVNDVQRCIDDVSEKNNTTDRKQNEILKHSKLKTDEFKTDILNNVIINEELDKSDVDDKNLEKKDDPDFENNDEIDLSVTNVKILSKEEKSKHKKHRTRVSSSLSIAFPKRASQKKNRAHKHFRNRNNETALGNSCAEFICEKTEGLQKKLDRIALVRTNGILGVVSKWNSVMLITLAMLNVAGQSSASDTSSFSSALTGRMIATFLGYPSTCTLGAEVRPCTLTLSCWLRGGTRLRGCGGWLFSCCGSPEPSRDFDNSIQSSDWKYKVSPPKLRQVPHRSVMPNNVFRRRVDDDVSQMDCGLPSSKILQKRIIGGREAQFAEFPWQAHVRISEFQCGGVLVSRRFVATAAHCVSRAHIRDIAVWLGAIDTSATHYPARKLGVVQKILHPLFQFRMTQPDRYDIALLKLSRLITYMSHILPICLPDYDMELRGRSGVIAGWGKTDASNGHTGTNLLRSATVPILSKEQCINWHQIKQISVEIHSEMICAGHSDGHQDACLGDSGGPLIVLDNGRYYLVGITSAGFGCGVDHQPGIYHNVKVTANWIRGVIAPSVNYVDSSF